MLKAITGRDASESSGLELLEELVRRLPRERRVFTTQALCFLMIGHYLVERWSLSESLRVLLETGAQKFLGRCKRVDRGVHSLNTSGISQARSALSIEALRSVWQALLSELKEHDVQWHGRGVKTIDGSSEALPPLSALRRAYPPTKNQFGESVYPVLQLTMMHDAMSGVAEDYELAPLNGDARRGELEQSRLIMSRLSGGTVVIADRGHGILQMVRHAHTHGLDVVYRLKEDIAKSLMRRNKVAIALQVDLDLSVEWAPSKEELREHPGWKPHDSIPGRIITKRVLSKDKELFLVLFTTLDKSFGASDIVKLYGHRWEIEGEIRDLKKAIGLSEITAHTPAMIAKEVTAAIVAYNIVRAVILAAAKAHGIDDPKRVSFKNAFVVVKDTVWRILEARTRQERDRLMERCLYWIAARVNKKRTRRSFPRTVYKRQSKYKPKRPNNDGVWA